MNIVRAYKKIPFVFKMIVGLVIGVIIGMIFGEKASVLEPIGTLFIRLLMMAAMPLIFLNIIYAVAGLNDPKLLGRIGMKIVCYYFATTFLAAITGIVAAKLINPGAYIAVITAATKQLQCLLLLQPLWKWCLRIYLLRFLTAIWQARSCSPRFLA